MFNDKNILITGGTGSFGQECVKVILEKYNPKKISIFSRDELKQHEMRSEFTDLRYIIGDVRFYDSVKQAIKGIDYVIHAAALKQVPIAENNPMEFVRTNIIGTENIIKACIDNDIKKCVLISTDKSVSPVNCYGATKLIAEKIFIAANNISCNKTAFSVVRYGNVIGSRGSVIPLFKKCLSSGYDYLPVTHPNMTRFLITLKQAIDFTFNSIELMTGGEIFLPKMPSVRIIDIVKFFNSKVKIVGIRPGEKLHEIMCSANESSFLIEFEDYFVIIPEIIINRDKLIDNYIKQGGELTNKINYSSDKNIHFLSDEEIREYLENY